MKKKVSIHTPTWGVTTNSHWTTNKHEFQSTHLHEVWLLFQTFQIAVIWFQSTHLHEVWLLLSFLYFQPASVSIHTPTWGVTFSTTILTFYFFVSIHTPTWGVTLATKSLQYVEQFQSTHLHEVWQSLFTVLAPITSFQSTHLHEVWLLLLTFSWCIIHSFNPHTYMRCDYVYRRLSVSLDRFNPHTYMRCDLLFC